jgi:dihydrofolate reductase
MVIGGGRVYAEFLPYADQLYLTHIDLVTPGDTFFPDYTSSSWLRTQTGEHPADSHNSHDFITAVYSRIGAAATL